MSETETDTGQGDLGDRVERLEDGQNKIVAKLDQLLGIGAGKRGTVGGDDEASPDGRPGSVEDQVRAELERAESERQKAESAQAEQSEREQMKAQLAKLTEVKPVQPQPRRQRLMWGKHGN